MQIANMVHGVPSLLMMAMFIGHIYIGTIGMKGAYNGDAHRLRRRGLGARNTTSSWYDDIKAGKIPAQRSAADAADRHMPAPQRFDVDSTGRP